ncbi:MAG TPA: Rid family hydrolase [Candidatus Limnocylindrales bacterium]|nr:Rid family hydrolase [Candidatus Limnocylindrales bacterium]
MPDVETLTPPNTPTPIGPYSHVARVGSWITIGGTAGVDPATGELAGDDAASQTRQILRNFAVMLEAAGSDLGHVVHVDVYLLDITDFASMNEAYIEAFAAFGDHRPARTAIGVAALPKAGAVVTMGLTAVVAS